MKKHVRRNILLVISYNITEENVLFIKLIGMYTMIRQIFKKSKNKIGNVT